jgi:hypothetical protein
MAAFNQFPGELARSILILTTMQIPAAVPAAQLRVPGVNSTLRSMMRQHARESKQVQQHVQMSSI